MNPNSFSKSFLPTFGNFDCHMNLKPSAILDYLQEVASKHGEILGLGREDLLKQGLFWVLTSIHYIIDQKIAYNEPISVKTWPLAPGRIVCDRDYVIEGEFGGKIRASAEWCLLDVNSRRIMPTKVFDYGIETFYSDKGIVEKTSKLRPFCELSEKKDTFTIKYSDLDYNFHVNNAKYGDYIVNSADNPEKIRELQIQYSHECKLGETVDVYCKTEENSQLFDARTQSGSAFLAKIVW